DDEPVLILIPRWQRAAERGKNGQGNGESDGKLFRVAIAQPSPRDGDGQCGKRQESKEAAAEFAVLASEQNDFFREVADFSPPCDGVRCTAVVRINQAESGELQVVEE